MTDEKNKIPKEAHAYTPGLKVKRFEAVKKTRRLPIHGKVFVNEGDSINHEAIVAKTELSGNPEIVKASRLLNVEPEVLPRYMLKHVGDTVKEGETIASYSAFFGLINKKIVSPSTGTIESISEISGQLIMRGAPIPIEVDAYIPGKVVKVMPNEGAVIETNAAFIQGIFGIGGEGHGTIKIAVGSPTDVLDGDAITSEDRDKILVGGSLVTLEAIEKGAEHGVSCIVSGGVLHEDLTLFTGEEVGVAITGQEELGITLIVTEGFGKMMMSQTTFDLLRSFDGYVASFNGATQIRAGVLRPEIIIPHEGKNEGGSEEALLSGIVPGTPVRIIRQPFFGAFGEVIDLPVELKQLESESFVRVLNVRLADGSLATIPRANVEIIEE